jgi:hypothetical protein
VISHREDARFVLDYPALVPRSPLIAMPGKHDRHAPDFVIGIIQNH